jgi:hypothetical protein
MRRFAVVAAVVGLASSAGLLVTTGAATPLTFAATADTYTFPQAPGWVTGDQESMKASSYSGIEATAWVAFGDLGSQIDVSTATATLQVHVLRASSDSVVTVFEAAGGWEEETLTHADAPQVGDPVATVVVSGDVLEVDVSGHLRGEGPTAFALKTAGTGVALVMGTTEGGLPSQLVVDGEPVPGAAGTAPHSSGPGTLFGASVPPWSAATWEEAVAQADAALGRLAVVRVFYGDDPVPWPGPAGAVDRPVVVSFKTPIEEVLAGEHDAALREWFANAPVSYDVYWSLHHEPEDEIEKGAFTAAQYRTAWRRVAALADEVGSERLRATLIVMNYTFTPKSGREIEDYYPGDGVLDVIAVDAYNTSWRRGEFLPAEVIVGPGADYAAAKGTGFGIAELGSRFVGDRDGKQRARWLRQVAEEARVRGAEFVTYWNSKARSVDYRLTDPAAAGAWREVVASSADR